MYQKSYFTRLIAVLLILCSLLGLSPSVALSEARAADKEAVRGITEDINSLVSSLTTLYNNILIPINQRKTITTSNQGALEGVYFLLTGVSDPGYRIMNPHAALVSKTLRLTANSCGETVLKARTGTVIPTVPLTLSGTSVNTLNGGAIRNLNQCVELSKFTGTVTKNTTQTTDHGTGWQGYLNWEWTRSNNWSGSKAYGSIIKQKFVT